MQREYLYDLMESFLLELGQKVDIRRYGCPGCSYDPLHKPETVHRHHALDCELCDSNSSYEIAIKNSAQTSDVIWKVRYAEKEWPRTKNGNCTCWTAEQTYRLSTFADDLLNLILPMIHFNDLASDEKALRTTRFRDRYAELNGVTAINWKMQVCTTIF